MSDTHEQLKAVLAEVRAEREADITAAVDYTREFRRLWDEEVGAPLARNWYTALKILYSKGLSREELYDAVMTAGASTAGPGSKFKYFCGVANTKLRQINEATVERFESRESGE